MSAVVIRRPKLEVVGKFKTNRSHKPKSQTREIASKEIAEEQSDERKPTERASSETIKLEKLKTNRQRSLCLVARSVCRVEDAAYTSL